MSGYPVTQIPLDAISGVHNGTGTWRDSLWTVVPDSVPPPRLLAFTGEPLQVTTMLFAIEDNVVPNWFGVVVPAASPSSATRISSSTPPGHRPGTWTATTG